MSLLPPNNQDLRYGITIDKLAHAIEKSEQTIYLWQRERPALLNAVAQQARDTLWSTSERRHRARQYATQGVCLPFTFSDGSTPDNANIDFPAFHRLMHFLSGSDLWLLNDALKRAKVKALADGMTDAMPEAVYADQEIISDAMDIQKSLTPQSQDLALTVDIWESLLHNIQIAQSSFPEITDAHLVARVTDLIEARREAIQAHLSSLTAA